jgi:NADH:ubiquinone oxidoreductase subunit 4 (subunit M)
MFETVSMIFFLLNIGIFLIKTANVMTYKFKPGERSLKYYDKHISIILFVVSLLAWLFMMVSFTASSAQINFLLSYGLPTTQYFEYGVFLALSNLFLVLNGILTFFEVILLGWGDIRGQQERMRRGWDKTDTKQKVPLRTPYK